MADLKPCPFCGSGARRYKGNNGLYGLTCKKCSAGFHGYINQGSATRA